MWGPSSALFQRYTSAPSSRTLPAAAGQTPTSSRASVDLPDPLGPITPTTSPAEMGRLRVRRAGTLEPGGTAVTDSSARLPSGLGRGPPSRRAGVLDSSSLRRWEALRGD